MVLPYPGKWRLPPSTAPETLGRARPARRLQGLKVTFALTFGLPVHLRAVLP